MMAKNETSLADLSRMRRERKETSVDSQLENESVIGTIENRDESVSSSVSLENKGEPEAMKAENEVGQAKKVGRPKGTRSNPDYESTTVLLNKKTKAKARYILSTRSQKMDLQTLLNSLLEDFVNQNDPFQNE